MAIPADAHYLVEHLIQRAMEEGKFDNLEGTGKPIADLDETYDENWWVKKFMRREQISLSDELREAYAALGKATRTAAKKDGA